MRKGYPTPDMPSGDITFGCIPVFVPNNPEFQGIFASAIYGLYAEMAKEYFWRETGTMSVQNAAYIAARGLAQTEAYEVCEGAEMSCEDIADCIETDEGVQTALVENLLTQDMINQLTTVINNNGFGNPNSINPSQTTIIDRNPSGALDEEIKELANCNLNALWGGIREGIVARLNDVTKDLLEDLNVIPTAAERLTIFIDTVPVIGDLAEGVALQITNTVPDILVLYESYESTDTLDEIACELFSIVCSECRYPTFMEVFEVYAAHTLIGVAITGLTLDAVATAILDLLTETNEVAFFTMSVQALFVLNLQAAFNGANGTRSIIRWAELGEDSDSDNWLDLCDSCSDTYFLWEWDFRTQGQGEFYHDTVNVTSSPLFVAGQGWYATNYSTARRFTVAFPFNTNWEIRAVAMLTSGTTPSNRGWSFRPNVGVTTGEFNSGSGVELLPEWTRAWEGIAGASGYKEGAFFGIVNAGQTCVLEKVSILFNVGHSPAGNGVPTSDLTPYTTP